MEPFSLEDFFLSPENQTTPGAQLYLYRLLGILASGDVLGGNRAPVPYSGAKQLAVRLGLNSPEKLASLFRDLGLGELSVNISPEAIVATLTHRHAPPALPSSPGSACELERGIIDGSLEIITGMAVNTSETSCWTKGSRECVFEAFIDSTGAQTRYVAGIAASQTAAGTSLDGGISLGRIRSWYLDLAARELARSRRHGRPLSIIYLDLDDLGKVNAEHGRKAGDQIISAVSAALSRACRTEDFLWYNGEDEFALLLSETDTETADVVAKRLATAIYSAAESIDFSARISASIGYSTFPAHAEDLSSLLESARSAQYLAKARGKGRTQVAVSEPVAPGAKEAGAATTPEGKSRTAWKSPEDGFTPRRSLTDPDDGITSAGTITKAINLVIAMSGPLLMAGIKQIFSDNKLIKIIEEVGDPLELCETIEDTRPDMIFTDMAMAMADDFAALRLIDEENLPCKFIIFADVVDQEVVKVAADFSVDGIILQSAAPKEIMKAMDSVYRGQSVVPEEAKTAMKELESQRQLLGELSDREREVLKLIAEGKSNSQIAEDLYITVNTVRFHLANIYQKLSVSNRTEAANCFLKQDIDSDSQTKLL